MTEPLELLTVPQAAGRLGLSRNVIYAEIKSGRLVAYRLGPRGGKLRVSTADIDAYLAARRVVPEPAYAPRALRYIKVRPRTGTGR